MIYIVLAEFKVEPFPWSSDDKDCNNNTSCKTLSRYTRILNENQWLFDHRGIGNIFYLQKKSWTSSILLK